MKKYFFGLLAACLLLGIGQTAVAQTPIDMWKRPWITVGGNDRDKALDLIGFEALGIDETKIRIARQPMPWKRSVQLYRFSGAWQPANLIFYYMRTPDGRFTQLDGTSQVIHAMNRDHAPVLNDDTIGAYVWFFTFFVRGKEGPFLVTETATDPFMPKKGLRAKSLAQGYSRPQDIPRPMTCSKAAGKFVFECSAIVYYSNGIFDTKLGIERSGMVTMLEDKALATDLSLRIDAPITLKDVGSAFKPGVPPQAPPVESGEPSIEALRGALEQDLFETVQALFEGRKFALTRNNMPFMAGIAGSMMERCGLPRDPVLRARLAAFTATSSVGAMAGFDYSNPDLSASIGSMTRQQALLASGALVTNTLGCSAGLGKIGENIARNVSANSAVESGFVASCAGVHGKNSCTCLANIGRQVIPDIAQRHYSPRLMKEIISRNPFIGLTIGLSCGISNY